MSPRLDGSGGLGGLDRLLAPLPVGRLAPDFVLPLVSPQAPHNSVLRLHGAGRRQPLVLVFYPMDWEPVSREQLTLYQAYIDTFVRLEARLLGISCDHVYSHDSFARDARIHFPLLADIQPRGLVARQFGVFREAQGVSARALFVLDRQRVVRFGKAYPDALNPGIDELLTTLEALSVEPAGDTPRDAPSAGR
jgi:alkyl hydroperoxide reductase subunit AhpC